MKKSFKHSKGKAVAMYLAAITMFGTMALSTDIAIGYLSNMQAYLHIQPVTASVAANPAGPSASAAARILASK